MVKLRHIAAAAFILAGCAASYGQLTAGQAFVDAPRAVFPLLDRDAKLDMVDYYNSGVATPTKNVMDGKSLITSMAPMKMNFTMTDASCYEIDMLPTADGDTLIALIGTVATPAPDSQMTLYTKDWGANVTPAHFTKPVLADWLTSEGKSGSGEVEGLVPFLLIGYTYDPGSRTLTLTNNTRRFLSADVYEIVEPCLKQTMTYSWNGKKFIAQP